MRADLQAQGVGRWARQVQGGMSGGQEGRVGGQARAGARAAGVRAEWAQGQVQEWQSRHKGRAGGKAGRQWQSQAGEGRAGKGADARAELVGRWAGEGKAGR
jgi:hypothetical protein